MTDAEFLRAIEACTLPKDAFTHRNHLRLAWLYLGDPAGGDPEARIARTIEAYARSVGAATKYNHSLTVRWMALVSAAMADTPAASFDGFLDAHPELLDRARVTVIPT